MSEPAGALLFETAPPRIYSIDPGRPFLHDLARALHEAAGGDAIALSDMRIFVPTRRAVRALTQAFVETAAGAASLLPRIRALGDVDEDEFLLDEPDLSDGFDLPPAISPMERRLVLARFVAAAERAFAGQENWPAALAAAKELGALLDSFYAEEVPFSRLQGLAPAEHARHWDRALDFLKIATSAWPDYVKARGFMDPAERRARLIDAQAKRFEAAPPEAPVIVAGTTGSAPAVARLISVVAKLPKGAVILPGLDRALAADEKAWSAVDDPHPQAGLKALLERLDLSPATICAFPGSGAPARRSALLSLALRPARATDDWRDLVKAACADDPGLAAAREGLTLIEAADEEDEANAVALLFRETLETPGRKAMLVTPDRNLGRRVAAKMRRWGVTVDDSAGIPLTNSPCGTYLRLAALWLARPGDPVAALSLARAGLAGFGLGRAERSRALAAFDEGLRGAIPCDGVAGLEKKLAENPRRAQKAGPILAALREAAALWPQKARAPFAEFLNAHIAAAEALARDAGEKGETRLWRGEDGETAAGLLAELRAMADAIGETAARDYAEGFSSLLAGASLRRRAPAHPRLAILGPLEARLQSADLVILGGLNEGVWPGEAASDPFLSRAMRRAAGLPSPERRLGLAAHDFAQLAAAPAVALTRARMAGGAPTKASRWIVRLGNILEGAGARAAIDASARLHQWARRLDQPEKLSLTRPPRPAPPVEARPRKLAVTRFEDLMRDPYAVYARYILRLKKLDPLAEPLGGRQLGRLLHAVFEKFVREGTDPAAPGARARLGALLDDEARRFGAAGAARVLWGPSLAAALDWFLAWDGARRREGAPTVIEGEGEWTFDAPAGPFTLTARADRIDILADGGAALFDYKTGRLPTLDQMKAKFSPQLPLTGLIVEAGGFEKLGPRRAESFHYVKALKQKADASDFSGAEGAKARTLIEEARKGLFALIAAFDNPQTPYLSQPRPQFLKEYADYNHLARRRDWASEEEGE